MTQYKTLRKSDQNISRQRQKTIVIIRLHVKSFYADKYMDVSKRKHKEKERMMGEEWWYRGDEPTCRPELHQPRLMG